MAAGDDWLACCRAEPLGPADGYSEPTHRARASRQMSERLEGAVIVTSKVRTRRDFLRLSGTAGGLAVGGSLLGAACGGERGSVKIGIADEAPYGFISPNGRVIGQAPQVARAVLSNIGIDDVQETPPVAFNELIPALNAGEFDIVCAGMNITPTRCAQAAFSIPDYSALTALIVPAGNPQQISNFADLAAKNLTVAVLSDAVEQRYAQDSGVPLGNIQILDDQNAMLQAVITGRTYCASLTDISLKWLVEQNPGAPVEVTPGFIPVIDGEEKVAAGGFVFRQADTDLRERFNTELRTLHNNGRWIEIASEFGFSDDNLPGELTTQQFCNSG